MAAIQSGGFTVGNSYLCNDDGIMGYTMSSNTFNGYPVFSAIQNIFRAGATYTCSDKRLGYRNASQVIGTDSVFCLMSNGYWIMEINAGSFTTVSGS